MTAQDAATQVVFKFPRPVSVENGRTLSIPILDRQVPAQRLALYQADTAGRNPLAAVRLTITTVRAASSLQRGAVSARRPRAVA